MICRLCYTLIKSKRVYTFMGASVHKNCRTKARKSRFVKTVNEAHLWLRDIWTTRVKVSYETADLMTWHAGIAGRTS